MSSPLLFVVIVQSHIIFSFFDVVVRSDWLLLPKQFRHCERLYVSSSSSWRDIMKKI